MSEVMRYMTVMTNFAANQHTLLIYFVLPQDHKNRCDNINTIT